MPRIVLDEEQKVASGHEKLLRKLGDWKGVEMAPIHGVGCWRGKGKASALGKKVFQHFAQMVVIDDVLGVTFFTLQTKLEDTLSCDLLSVNHKLQTLIPNCPDKTGKNFGSVFLVFLFLGQALNAVVLKLEVVTPF
jgi:hypothetical protein